MASWHEQAFGFRLQSLKIPFLLDGRVKPFLKDYVENKDKPSFYYSQQMDLVTLPVKTRDVETKIPIDWELDDRSHDELIRLKKDDARDIRLIRADKWEMYAPINAAGHGGWAIVRIPYRVLDGIYRRDFSIKTKRKNKTYSKNLNNVINTAINCKTPQRIVYK